MNCPLPTFCSRSEVQVRLAAIFPEGMQFHNYITRDMAAATVFAMLYVGAVAGSGRYLGPKQVYRMSDEQASLVTDDERVAYASDVLRKGFVGRGQAWYADNTRESIRDETLRHGLIPIGAAIDKKDVPTTSGKPRYALTEEFAALFAPNLVGDALTAAIEAWRATHLSKAARARVTIVRAGRTKHSSNVTVTLPSGESRRLTPGTSAVITKAVVEEFASRFLDEPAVLWISESGKKVVEKDDLLARSINLTIDPAKNLPDVILADVGTDEVLIVFVEVVATDGPISELRRADLLQLAGDAGIPPERVAFVTAYLDRSVAPLRKNFADLAWGTFVWVASEPGQIVALTRGVGDSSRSPVRLSSLVPFCS